MTVKIIKTEEGWISVKSALPIKDNWKVYLVRTDDDYLHKHQVAWFQYSDKTFRLEKKPYQEVKVTHWMSIPMLVPEYDENFNLLRYISVLV